MRPESGPSRRAHRDSGRTRRPAPGDPGARGESLAPHAHLPGDRQSSASAVPGRANPKPGCHPPRQCSAGGRLAPGFRSIESRPSRARDGLAPGSAGAPRLVVTLEQLLARQPGLDRRTRRIRAVGELRTGDEDQGAELGRLGHRSAGRPVLSVVMISPAMEAGLRRWVGAKLGDPGPPLVADVLTRCAGLALARFACTVHRRAPIERDS